MEIDFEKRHDGDVLLTMRRADGSTSWKRSSGINASFFALHDLSHFAVETTLATREGFYGVVAAGRDINDFGTAERKGEVLPPESLFVELLIGLLDGERLTGPWQCDALNQQLQTALKERGLTYPAQLTEAQLVALRHNIASLHQQWTQLAPGQRLQLVYHAQSDAPPTATATRRA